MGRIGQIAWNKGKKMTCVHPMLGKHHTTETRQKISVALTGTKHSEETIRKRTLSIKKSYEGRISYLKGKQAWNKGIPMSEITKKRLSLSLIGKTAGEKNVRWIKDRTKLKATQKRNDSAYYEWRKQVWLRDNYKCKIVNPDCKGIIEAHHILGWSEFPELRYQLNNGITLCHAHHPRKRSEEKRLSPYFQSLVSVSNE